MVVALGVENRCQALDAVYLVPPLKDELREIGPVLPRDACYQGSLCHVLKISLAVLRLSQVFCHPRQEIGRDQGRIVLVVAIGGPSRAPGTNIGRPDRRDPWDAITAHVPPFEERAARDPILRKVSSPIAADPEPESHEEK